MKIFGLTRFATLTIFILTGLLMLGMFWRIFINGTGKSYYQVISPNGDYHLTTYILETHGCIIFIDELGIENRICGSYTVKKL
jgi:hypothetical protein